MKFSVFLLLSCFKHICYLLPQNPLQPIFSQVCQHLFWQHCPRNSGSILTPYQTDVTVLFPHVPTTAGQSSVKGVWDTKISIVPQAPSCWGDSSAVFHLYLKSNCLEKDLLLQHTEKVKNDSQECTPNPRTSGSDVTSNPWVPTLMFHVICSCVWGFPFKRS